MGMTLKLKLKILDYLRDCGPSDISEVENGFYKYPPQDILESLQALIQEHKVRLEALLGTIIFHARSHE